MTKIKQIETIKSEASEIFWSNLKYKKIPTEEAIKTATANTEEYLENQFLSEEVLNLLLNRSFSKISGSTNKKIENIKDALRLLFIEEKIKLTQICPIINLQVSILRLSIGSAIGSLFFAFLFQFVAKLFHFESSIILVFGGVFGAFLFTFLLGKIATNKKLRLFILATLGVAGLAEISIIRFFKIKQVKKNLIKKIGLFFLVVFAVIFVKAEETFNKAKYKELLKNNIEEWCNKVTVIIELLAEYLKNTNDTSNNSDTQALTFIMEEFSKIDKSTSKEDILQQVDFILLYLKHFGINSHKMEGGQKDLIWTEKLSSFYEKYGIIEDGDKFLIEKEAVLKDSSVIAKGLVRRVRDK
ncbi:MAG: hypothetical protein K5751_00870 [Treponemataceae bacterium]|nr:hypothetical protein [Treponemataceae bacterium]